MLARDFCYWLQGFFEVSKATELNAEQTQQLRNHLNLVFEHDIDPTMGDAKKQKQLNKTHSGGPGGVAFTPPGKGYRC